jgi:hypothetical protein
VAIRKFSKIHFVISSNAITNDLPGIFSGLVGWLVVPSEILFCRC